MADEQRMRMEDKGTRLQHLIDLRDLWRRNEGLRNATSATYARLGVCSKRSQSGLRNHGYGEPQPTAR